MNSNISEALDRVVKHAVRAQMTVTALVGHLRERMYAEALKQAGGNKRKAASLVGSHLSRGWYYRNNDKLKVQE